MTSQEMIDIYSASGESRLVDYGMEEVSILFYRWLNTITWDSKHWADEERFYNFCSIFVKSFLKYGYYLIFGS